MNTESAKWYIIQVYAGAEQRVVETVLERAEKEGLRDHFLELVVPTENVVELKNGEKVNTVKKFLPGYILVKMVLTDRSMQLVKSTPRVSCMLGVKGKPMPVKERDIENVLKQASDSTENPRNNVVFDVGEQIKITDGPFCSFTGFIEEVDDEKQKLKISVVVFGRPTPITLDYTQVEKV